MTTRHQSNPLDSAQPDSYFSFPRSDVIDVIKSRNLAIDSVLELGCASGVTAKKLIELHNVRKYIGIESDFDAATKAKQILDQVFPVNIEEIDIEILGIEKAQYDLLLALDVLEHLYDPWSVLATLSTYVRSGGHVIVSIPNIQNVNVLHGLAEGKWQYAEAGLLDATHIRFFTLETMRELIAGAGLQLQHVHAVLSPRIDLSQFNDGEQTVDLGKLTIKGVSREELTAFFAYQYILVAQKP